MLTTNITFDRNADGSTGSGNGWVMTSWDDELEEPVMTTNTFATYTAAAAAQKALFAADVTLAAHLTVQAQTTVLAAQQAAVTTALNARKTAEGLT